MKPKKWAAWPLTLLLTLALLSGCAAKPGDTSKPSSGTSKPSEITEPSSASAASPSEISEPSNSSVAASSEIAEPTDPSLLALQEEIRAHACSAGMAFLGAASEDTTESALRSFLKSSQYAEKYAFLADAPLVDAGGTELYAVVTAEKECLVSVYRAALTDSGEYDVRTDDALYEGVGMNCFLLRCNVGDLHANAVVSFQTGDTIFSVFPMLSGADGRLVAEGCYDFSLYAEDNHSPNSDAIIAYGLLSEASEVQYYMGLGMTLQYTGQTQIIDGRSCWVFDLGTEHDNGQFVREHLYGVCDNLIYTYDALSDTWRVLGTGQGKEGQRYAKNKKNKNPYLTGCGQEKQ